VRGEQHAASEDGVVEMRGDDEEGAAAPVGWLFLHGRVAANAVPEAPMRYHRSHEENGAAKT
jgi:hypothetical protein